MTVLVEEVCGFFRPLFLIKCSTWSERTFWGVAFNNSIYAGDVGEVILANFFSWSEKSEIFFIIIYEK